jgi:hypothetical protein
MEDNPYKAQVDTTVRCHSPFGIASFVVACLMVVLFPVLVGISELIDARRGVEWLETIGAAVAVLFFLGFLLAVVLGIVGVLQKGRKKILSALGISLACILVGCLALVAIYSGPRAIGGPVEIRVRR